MKFDEDLARYAPSFQPMTEKEFIESLKKREPKAFQILVKDYSLQVINTCFKFLLVKEDAEDLAQEVFLEVYQSIGTFRNESKLSTWIYRIAVTKCIDEIKRRKRKKRISSLGKIIGIDEIHNEIISGYSADKKLDDKDRLKIIQQALDKLPTNQRIAYSLSKIEGYSNADIADVMGLSLFSVEALIKRGKQKLIQELKFKINDANH